MRVRSHVTLLGSCLVKKSSARVCGHLTSDTLSRCACQPDTHRSAWRPNVLQLCMQALSTGQIIIRLRDMWPVIFTAQLHKTMRIQPQVDKEVHY